MRVRRWSTAVLVTCALAVSGCTSDPGPGGVDTEGFEVRHVETLPLPDDGRRWAVWHDVAVQVPSDWGEGAEPGEDWCADRGGDTELERPDPYVARESSQRIVLAIGCFDNQVDVIPDLFGPAPELLWQDHLTFEPAVADAYVTETYEDWTTSTRTVGDVRLRVLTDEPETINRVLGSAVVFETDHLGCDASSPVSAEALVRPDPFDVAAVEEVQGISVCQYDRTLGGGPALIGSTRLGGAEADALLAGLRSAPVGGGPDRPKSCTHDELGATAVVIRLHAGDDVHHLYAYYDHCFGNGIDDGTTRRELTRDTCAPLFVEPVRLFEAAGRVFGRCATTD